MKFQISYFFILFFPFSLSTWGAEDNKTSSSIAGTLVVSRDSAFKPYQRPSQSQIPVISPTNESSPGSSPVPPESQPIPREDPGFSSQVDEKNSSLYYDTPCGGSSVYYPSSMPQEEDSSDENRPDYSDDCPLCGNR